MLGCPGNLLRCDAPQDLYARTQHTEGVKKAKLCMHTGTFVYHFKGKHSFVSGVALKQF